RALFSSAGDRLITFGSAGGEPFDLVGDSFLWEVKEDSKPLRLARSALWMNVRSANPDLTRLLTMTNPSRSNRVAVVEFPSGKEMLQLKYSGRVFSAEFDRKGTRI